MAYRIRQLRGLDGLSASRDDLINFLDSLPLISRSQATSAVVTVERVVEKAAADAAEARVTPKVESAVKKGIAISIGASLFIGFVVVRLARRG